MAMTALISLALAGAALPAADRAALDAAVQTMFRPYKNDNNPTAAWQQPIYSAETAALIRRWQQVMPEGEIDDLSGGDWLCLCQDWNAARFRATVTSREMLSRDAAQLRVAVNLGEGTRRTQRLVFRRERGRWWLDDLYAEGFERGLKQALRSTIAADIKLKR